MRTFQAYLVNQAITAWPTSFPANGGGNILEKQACVCLPLVVTGIFFELLFCLLLELA